MIAAVGKIDDDMAEHMPLVYHTVKVLLAGGYLRQRDREQAVQEGRIGLWRALSKWTCEAENGPWSRYAYVSIKRAIVRHFGRERASAQILAAAACRYAALQPEHEDGPDKPADALDERLGRLRKALAALPSDSAELLCLRHGINGYRPHTVTALSKLWKCPPLEVIQREREAMWLVREALAASQG